MVAIEFTALDTDSTATAAWRLDRVSFATAERPIGSLEFHPRLNVVVVDDGRVDEVVAQLRGTLADDRDGTHVEFTLTDGPALVAFRPIGSRHRLIDIVRAEERPLELLRELAEGDAGLDGDDGRAVVGTLSILDQQPLWAAAGRFLSLRAESAGTEGAVVALPGGEGAAPTIDLRSQPKRRLLRRWAKAAPTPDDLSVQLAEAARTWQTLAGPLDPEVAVRYRDRCEAASRVLVRLGALAAVSADGAPGADDGPIDEAAAIEAACALVPLRRAGGGPHIVAVPGPARGELTSLLLDHLAALSGERQIVAVTCDEAVVDWARLEHHARRAALLRLDADA